MKQNDDFAHETCGLYGLESELIDPITLSDGTEFTCVDGSHYHEYFYFHAKHGLVMSWDRKRGLYSIQLKGDPGPNRGNGATPDIAMNDHEQILYLSHETMWKLYPANGELPFNEESLTMTPKQYAKLAREKIDKHTTE